MFCSICGIDKEQTEFHKAHKTKRGFTFECKPCRKIIRKAYIDKDKKSPDSNDRKCNKCNEVKSLNEFYKDKSSSDGYGHYCKLCLSIIHTEYRGSHKKQISKNAKYWRSQNKEYLYQRKKQEREANPEACRARIIAWQKANPEREQERRKRGKIARRLRNQENPVNDLTIAQWREILIVFGYRCAYCNRKMQRLTQDHITPLSKGGPHTMSNVVPACRSCNSKKHTGPPPVPVQPLLLTVASANHKKECNSIDDDSLSAQ